jgi:hypothetical protein
MGLTKGRGKADMAHCPNRSIKRIFGYSLVDNWRARLTTAGS